MTAEFAVELHSVVKKFPNPGGGEVRAVDQVTLQINPGEFFSLLGSSGCGKTTTLRMIAGFEWPTEGEIYIQGQPMGRIPPYQRPVNTVFQSYALFPHMNIGQNVAFGLEMEHLSKAEVRQRVGEALEMVQLSGMESRKPRQCSGGQQQRVALARALVKRPTVLLLDEPLGALDLKLRKEMQLELKSLQERVGITFIYVTHDQEEALTMSDRIAVMDQGRVRQIGGPVEIYERPNCRFVADFIGESNFLSGQVVEVKGERAAVRLQEPNIILFGLNQGDLIVGQNVVFSVRPEKIRLSEQSALNENCLPGQVLHSVYIGSDTRVVVSIGSGKTLIVWEQNRISTLDSRAYYTPGQDVFVNIFRENALILANE